MREIAFYEANYDDIEEIHRLHGFSNVEIWQHEYWDYLPEKANLFVAKDQKKIVATEGFMPYLLNFEGNLYLTARSERTLVDPEYRGDNLFAKLMEYCASRGIDKGFQFIWGSTGALKPFRRAGFRVITGNRLYLMAIVNPLKFLKDLKNKDYRVPLSFTECLKVIRKRDRTKVLEYAKSLCFLPSIILRSTLQLIVREKTRENLVITSVPKSYKDIYGLYIKLRREGPLMYLQQDDAFCEWMLEKGHNPTLKLFGYINDELVGYLYINVSDPKIASIIDFAAIDTQVFRILLSAAYHRVRKLSKTFLMVTCNIANAQQKRLLPQFCSIGLVPFYLGGTTVIRPLSLKEPKILSNMAYWYLTDLWYMLFRERS